MSDFEVQVLDILKSCQSSLYVIGIVALLSFLGCLGGLLVWSIYKDRETADHNKKELKNEIIEEINNAKK